MSLRALFLAVLAFPWAPVAAAAADAAPGGPDVLGDAYPRAFFFRASEALARRGRTPYPEWEGLFSRLGGIMGKVLDEEVPLTQEPNLSYFTRFKAAHPRQAVLLHFNGNARDPRWERDAFFAGHWLYHNGCRVTADVPAEAGEATLQVGDPSLFRVNMGRYANANEDLGICLLGPNGKPDWSRSEQLELLAIDAGAKTLRVRRGAFGTTPRAFPAGKAYVAAHVCEGPWGKRSHLLWYYNYSTACPRDGQGRNCTDVLVEDVAHRFLPGGALAAFDGLEFDVLMYRVPGGGLRAPDADADGKPDGGIFEGVNTYGIGVVEFCRRLRERLGRSKLILADGHAEANQRAFGVLNGIESEGWPSLSDPEVIDWSGGLNRHEFWRRNACEPRFSYINHKYVTRGDAPGEMRTVKVAPGIHRLVLAAGLFTDSAFTYSLAAPAAPGEKVGIYDELRMGTANRLHWLGGPLGLPTRLALRAPDLLQGAGTRWADALLRRLRPDAARLERDGQEGALRVSAPEAGSGVLAFTLPDLPLPEGDLFVRLRLKADPMKGYPREIARLAWVGWQQAGDLLRPRPLATGMALRGGTEEALRPETGATVRYQAAAEVAGEGHRAYFVHPPYRGGTGYAFWETTARVPAGKPRLLFHTALSDRAKATSDGVVMKVDVRGAGAPEEVVTLHHRERRWVARSADLSRWAGKEVCLRFTVDAGPADNSIADQAHWGDVRIVEGDGADAAPRALPLTPSRVMTWMNGEWFEAGFYFRDLGPDTVDLSFEFEGEEPVLLADLTAHSAADAIIREYGHGVVLANPGTAPYAFDLAALFPGRKLRRLQGSPQQDPAVNDGSPAGAAVTVGARDALFLVKE